MIKLAGILFLMGGSRKVKETLFCMTKDIRAVLIYYPVGGYDRIYRYAGLCHDL